MKNHMPDARFEPRLQVTCSCGALAIFGYAFTAQQRKGYRPQKDEIGTPIVVHSTPYCDPFISLGLFEYMAHIKLSFATDTTGKAELVKVGEVPATDEPTKDDSNG